MRVPADDADGMATAITRLLGLLDPAPAVPDLAHGYLDLIGAAAPQPSSVAEWLMRSSFVPAIYQRWWRPTISRLIMGTAGPGMAGEYRLARSWLALSPGDILLDVACGPGNFTRELAAGLGDAGLAIGLDASASMLARAVRDTAGGAAGRAAIGYVRADAQELPLRGESVDAVSCFAALHLMREPLRALDKMTSVLRPGGRIALMTSCRPGSGGAFGAASDLAGRITGLAVFGRDEITDALAARGYTAIRQRIAGTVQFVAGQRPGGTPTAPAGA